MEQNLIPTKRALIELIGHEAIVREAYRDSKKVWTWGPGITSASGHRVERYRDNPQSIEHCLAVFVWLLRSSYLPDVARAFAGATLTEAQLAAALSFHWNTGAILQATWVKTWLSGRKDAARAEFMNWRKPPEIIPRREKERDLFFDGKWSGDGKTTIYQRVRKPSYAPDWSSAVRVDIGDVLAAALA